VPAALLGGAGVIAVAVAWTRLFPALRRIEHLTAEPPLARQ